MDAVRRSSSLNFSPVALPNHMFAFPGETACFIFDSLQFSMSSFPRQGSVIEFYRHFLRIQALEAPLSAFLLCDVWSKGQLNKAPAFFSLASAHPPLGSGYFEVQTWTYFIS